MLKSKKGEEKIMTLHPEGKNGVNISKKKYDIICDYILKKIHKQKKITFKQLFEEGQTEIKNFDGKIGWYIVTVKLDLEARKIIERIPKTSPHQVRMVK
jgi:fructose-1,6-bisphosphatase